MRYCKWCKNQLLVTEMDYCSLECHNAYRRTFDEYVPPRVIDKYFIDDKYKWSCKTFGSAKRVRGLVKHIRSELKEVLAKPSDIYEWVDIVLLALDGMSRQGFSGEEIIAAIIDKQDINTKRTWSVTQPTADQPSFHVKDSDE